ncbi:MAG: bacillithiol biosynthesis protein BshC, partial [Candidatus Eiseniibacteriota bacterium]
MTSRTALLGRIDVSSGDPLGPLLSSFARRDPSLLALLPRRYDDSAGLLARARARLGAPLTPALAGALGAQHRRLDASARSLSYLAQVAEGKAVCVVAGQQPGPLGGPLYTWHKVHTAVALARVLSAQGVPAVPVFWNASEDDDFDEIAHASWAGSALAPAHGQLAREASRAKRLVGALPAGLAAPIWQAARGAWAPLPGAARALSLLHHAARSAER